MQKSKSTLKRIADAINPYGWITCIRNRAFDCGKLESKPFGLPIICIGNISVGGTGKTPHTEYFIKLLKNNWNIAVLSRGYGRKSKGYIKAEESTPMPQIGDEPFQIKHKFPEITVAVCEKRVTGVENLLKEHNAPSVILLDDAYQHRHIKAGLYILLVDYNRPIWSDTLLPFGRLRESDEGANRADIVIITKCDKNITSEEMKECKTLLKTKEGTPVFFSMVEYGTPYPLFPETVKAPFCNRAGNNILLITGIAKPEPLKKEAGKNGASVTIMQYPDHHNFTGNDLEEMAAKLAKMPKGTTVLTTEKDATRLRSMPNLPQSIKECTYVIPIEIKILNNEEEMFNQTIIDYVTENTRNG